MPKAGWEWARSRAPETALAVLACIIFLGCLGGVELWGKREQRASVEAIDTLERGHWLVAEIQGRPRLEKPPLPRWTIAALMALTGRRDEWMVRFPSALSALGMVALVYTLGRRIGGRSAGLASALVLTSCGYFVGELRQSGNDGPLAFFTTLAIYAAWRRLHGGPIDSPIEPPGDRPGGSRWAILMSGALGLGILTKGPIILLLASLAIVPYLAINGRLGPGLRLLRDGWGLALMLALGLSWPIVVLIHDPNAATVWYLEMAQKAGSAGVKYHRPRELLALAWPLMTAPWPFVGLLGVLLPFAKPARALWPGVWLPWSWAVINLVMFCFWSIAKPNYYIPCLPGAAILIGLEWVRLCQLARATGTASGHARRFLLGHWVGLFVAAPVALVVVGQRMPSAFGWALVVASAVIVAVPLSVVAWRRGADAGALFPLVGAQAVLILVGYGVIAPSANASHSHRLLAATLNRLVPPEAPTIMFYRELDEGLWFYLKGRALKPVPETQPLYNKGYDLLDAYQRKQLVWDDSARLKKEEQVLLDWLQGPRPESEYLLIRTKVYDMFAPDLAGLVIPIHAERDLDRNELTLLRLDPDRPRGPQVARRRATADPERRR